LLVIFVSLATIASAEIEEVLDEHRMG
jgi:hypothetical protein